MPNLAETLKSEIIRLARKELRAGLEPVSKATSGHRREIAALKRVNESLRKEVLAMGKELDLVRKQVQTVKETQGAFIRTEAGDQPVARRGRKLGMTSKGIKTLRERLGLSGEDFGLLVGVSGASIYGWETGKSSPRPKPMEALTEIRTISKKALLTRLAALQKGAK